MDFLHSEFYRIVLTRSCGTLNSLPMHPLWAYLWAKNFIFETIGLIFSAKKWVDPVLCNVRFICPSALYGQKLYEDYPVTRGYPWLLCNHTFLVAHAYLIYLYLQQCHPMKHLNELIILWYWYFLHWSFKITGLDHDFGRNDFSWVR